LQVLVRVTNRFDKKTLPGVARHHGGLAGFAALPHPFPRIEQQTTFQFLRLDAVTFVTALDENRADSGLEKIDLARLRVGSRRDRQNCGRGWSNAQAQNPSESEIQTDARND
jgi:hypothetical protein